MLPDAGRPACHLFPLRSRLGTGSPTCSPASLGASTLPGDSPKSGGRNLPRQWREVWEQPGVGQGRGCLSWTLCAGSRQPLLGPPGPPLGTPTHQLHLPVFAQGLEGLLADHLAGQHRPEGHLDQALLWGEGPRTELALGAPTQLHSPAPSSPAPPMRGYAGNPGVCLHLFLETSA